MIGLLGSMNQRLHILHEDDSVGDVEDVVEDEAGDQKVEHGFLVVAGGDHEQPGGVLGACDDDQGEQEGELKERGDEEDGVGQVAGIPEETDRQHGGYPYRYSDYSRKRDNFRRINCL